MKLRWILLTLLAPMVGLLGFYVWLQIDRLDKEAAQAGQVYDVIAEVRLLREAQYHLGAEMALAAGVLGSFGDAGAEGFAAQVAVTDAALDRLQTGLSLLTGRAPQAGDRLTTLTERLGVARGNVDDLLVPANDGRLVYAALLEDLDRLAEAALSIRADSAVLDRLRAMAALSEVRLWSAREAALGATAVTEWSFNTVAYSEFLTAIRLEGIGLETAGRLSGQPALGTSVSEGAAWAALQDSRNAIFRARLGSGDWEALSFDAWIGVHADWQAALQGIETELIEDTLSLAAVARSTANDVRRRQLWTAIGAAILVVGLAVLIFEIMSRRIRQLRAVLFEFANDRFDLDVPCLNGGSEICDLARSIEELKVKTLAIRAENDRIREANEAELNAKHQQVVDLVTEGLRALAEADLSLHFDVPLAPEYDAIRTDFNTAAARLRTVLGALAETAGDLDSRAGNMRGTAGDLAGRTERQVETIGHAGDAVGALVAAQDTAREALGSAKSLADDARARADESREVVRRAIAAMDRISGSSEQISQISALIEDIAFQTNLLALNAGVEAARAGSAGKGFAVVAEEVRELASRSASAAMDIKKLIEESGREIRTGVELVDETGGALEAIRDRVRDVDETIAELARAADGQTRSLDAVLANMTELHSLTGQNTEVAEASRSAATDLARQAGQLSRLVGEFTLGQGATRSPQTVPKRAA
ncbi:methyl-accepting chemotaxis protein [Mameliella alba]|nr:methyl-accepting chemotaxis protein [Mameliella alba]MBY6172334.1 methyl-accepting chemotaxis protein [Mameliella alba]MBY6176128.1 methyl-accepting chemotaxis protein [Mameliella alba]